MVRILLVVLLWPLAVLVAISAFEWFSARFADRSPPDVLPVERPAVSYPGLAHTALQAFAALRDGEQAALRAHLERQLRPVSDWAPAALGDRELVCFGERHSEATRRFLAEEIFTRVPFDRLMLEATPDQLADIEGRLREGASHAPLLGADIGAVIRSAREARPGLALSAIEETDAQRSARYATPGGASRDDSILANFRAAWRPGQRHAILFGALHCTANPAWLFGVLQARAPPGLSGSSMLNVLVVGEHQNGQLEAFAEFLAAIGVHRGHFVIPDTTALDPRLRDWFAVLMQNLGQYSAVMVFRQD